MDAVSWVLQRKKVPDLRVLHEGEVRPMEISLGSPMWGLDRWATLSSYHVVPWTVIAAVPEIRNFYQLRRRQGAYIIVTSYAPPEGGTLKFELDGIIDAARALQAQEVEIPSYRGNTDRTEGAWESIRTLRNELPSWVMVTPQAENPDDWRASYLRAVSLSRGDRPDVVGVPDYVHPSFLQEEGWPSRSMPLHLHGLGSCNPNLLASLRSDSIFRGVHTNVHLIAALQDVALDALHGWEWNGPDYFDDGEDDVPESLIPTVDWNVMCLLRWVNGYVEGSI